MTWKNPPKLIPTKAKPAKIILPEDLAASDSEDGLQAAVFCWAAMNVDKWPQLKYMFAVPNGGFRHKAEAAKFVGTGVRAGVPDIFLAHWGYSLRQTNRYFGLFIEMKTEKRRKEKDGGCSKEQLEWLVDLANNGYCVAVCYGWQDARDTLINYLEGKC